MTDRGEATPEAMEKARGIVSKTISVGGALGTELSRKIALALDAEREKAVEECATAVALIYPNRLVSVDVMEALDFAEKQIRALARQPGKEEL